MVSKMSKFTRITNTLKAKRPSLWPKRPKFKLGRKNYRSFANKHFFNLITVFMVIATAVLFAAGTVRAASAELVPNSNIVSGWPTIVGSSGCTGACGAVNEGSTPDVNSYIATTTANTAQNVEFGMTTQADIAEATQIRLRVYANITQVNGGTADTLTLRALFGSTEVGNTTVTPSAGSYSWRELTINDGSWTQAQIDSLQVRIERNILGSGSPAGRPDVIRVSTVYVELTYEPDLPDANLAQSSYRWFSGDNVFGFNNPEKLANPSQLPTGNAHNSVFSPDSKYMVVAHDTSPFITIYEVNSSTNTFTKLTNPSQLPTGLARDVAFSPDGKYLSVAHYNSPHITIYEVNSATNTFTKITNPSQLPLDRGQGVAFSSNGKYLSVAHDSSPFVIIYEIDSATNTFTKLANPAQLPTDQGTTTSFSPDGKYLIVMQVTSPYTNIYEIDSATNTFTKLANPAQLPTGWSQGVAFSPNGKYLSIGHNQSPNVTIYEINSTTNTFTKLANPSQLPASTTYGVDFSPDGKYMTLGHTASPYITTYEVNSDTNTFTKTPNPNQLPGGDSRGVAYSPDGKYLSVPHWGSPYLAIYSGTASVEDPLAAQNTSAQAPAEGVPFRLRTTLSASGGELPVDTQFKLQYAQRAGATCSLDFSAETYQDVEPQSGGTVQNTGFVSPTIMSSSGTTGPWSNPQNATALNGSYASSTFVSTGQSALLVADGFNFNIPTGANIVGIETSLNMRRGSNTLDGGVVRILSGSNNRVKGVDPTTTFQYLSSGGASDVWGGNFSADEVNNDFQLRFNYYELTTAGKTLLVDVDHIMVRVHYTEPPILSYYDNPSIANGSAIAASANDPSPGSGTARLQSYVEGNNFTNPNAIPAGDYGVWDFSLVDNNAPAETHYCFRIVYDSGTVLNTYTVIPVITTSPPSFAQDGYRWFGEGEVGADFEKLNNPSQLPASSGNGTAFSPDGKYMSVAHDTSPFITIYEIDSSTNTFTKLANPSTLPAGTGQGTAFSPDGKYMSVAHTTSPFITIYEINSATNTFTKLANPSQLPASTGRGTAFSPDGKYMSVAHTSSPFITVYEINSATNTFTKLANPGTLPTGTGYGTAFSPDGKYMSVAHATSPFITIYEIDSSTNTFTKLANPAELPPVETFFWATHTTFSPDGKYMSVAHSTSPFITIYEIDSSTNTFTKLANPALLPAATGWGTTFSPDGKYMSVAHTTSPFITIYEINSATNTFTKLANPSQLPASTGRGTAFSPDGKYMSVAHDVSPFVTIYETGSIELGEPLASQNQPAEIEANASARLRMLMNVDDKTATAGDFKLQYAPRTGLTCSLDFSAESYQDVEFDIEEDIESLTRSPSIVLSTDWLNSANVFSSNNTYATYNSVSPGTIKLEGFGFNIPSNSTISGIELLVEKSAQSIGIEDSGITLLKNGSQAGQNKNSIDDWPTSDTVFTYGSPTDLWGAQWTPEDINSLGFGASVGAISYNGATARIDHVQLRVYYEIEAVEASGFIVYSQSIGASTGAPISSDPDDPTNGRTKVNQVYVQSNNFSLINSTSRGATAMFDFSIKDNAESGGSYCFRIVRADGSLLDGYNHIAELNTKPRIPQFMRHGRWFDVTGSNRPFYWGRQP
jgi:6-phosphogluconolactonase (cycloisomerase 2 family)